MESTAKALNEARLSCGGIGFSHYAGIVHRMNDHNVQETWEGDNNVLIQQASKFLLEIAKTKFRGKNPKLYSLQEWFTLNPVNEERFSGVLDVANLIDALRH